MILTKARAREFFRNKLPGEKIFTVTWKFSALKAYDHIYKEPVPGVQNVYEHTKDT